MDWQAAFLTVKIACCTTAILFVVGVPLAYWLAMSKWRVKFVVEAIVALPIVLPPTVLGFYILMATGPQSIAGQIYERTTGSRLPFSFAGILLGSVLFNLPFTVRPFTAAFASMNRRLIEASWCLGETRWGTFRRVTLPLCWPGLLAGVVLTFAHTVGEFGVVLMVGGNIPGVTRTLSISIYDDVQSLNYTSASQTALVMVAFSFFVLCVAQLLGGKGLPGRKGHST